MRIVLIIQARMGSSRLPGKVMLDLCGKTVLEHVIDRCRAISLVDHLVVATTVNTEDDRIEQCCLRQGISCYRGDEYDVLARYYKAAKKYRADIVVRVTSDCPLIDPGLAEEVICMFLEQPEVEYCSNDLIETFPRGLNVEVFSFRALEYAYEHAVNAYEREHVTPYIYEHPERFRVATLTSNVDYSRHRWTLDTKKDWILISEIYRLLYQGDIMPWKEVIDLVERYPELPLINADVVQKKLGE
ncbi:glycosyltransferase family protein [Paenibacillus thiaminolyticus]|uniref:glycosyltransferase family protein n=1 Tax=Paenibacillus thiaminolyticus TaxID=49283 RepID=UPI00232ADA9E|nr:glycosyltransferase family protein [Paenibacillus thiaminolyticus]WCF07929.1 glycosyltransferase family protein [Paenibacillus thiaminolyticus]